MDTKRHKRGIVKGSGTFIKSITGNLDDSDGEFFSSTINRLNQVGNLGAFKPKDTSQKLSIFSIIIISKYNIQITKK